MNTLTLRDGSKWISRGGYEVDKNDEVSCYWCIELNELPYFDVDFCSYTKIILEDVISIE